MNNIKITTDKITPDVTLLEMKLSQKTESVFKQSVFPFLFDGRTTGVRSELKKGRVKYSLLVYDITLIKLFEQILINVILEENGQMN